MHVGLRMSRESTPGWPQRLVMRGWVLALIAATRIVDAGPDWLRFGKGRGVRNRVLAKPLLTLSARSEVGKAQLRRAHTPPIDEKAPVVLLMTQTLGTGGVEAIVFSLALELPRYGLRPLVLCTALGNTADALLRVGTEVTTVADRASTASVLEKLPGGTVAQAHNAPAHMVDECQRLGIPTLRVVHTTDVNLAEAAWESETSQASNAAGVVAVSERVKEFYMAHLAPEFRGEVVVIPNGVDLKPATVEDNQTERERLGSLLGVDLRGDVLVVCLARYELQKNIPGTVASFLRAADVHGGLRLIVAGPVEDWLEYALADGLRRAHPAGHRVHLLGVSDAGSLLAAADAFLLDSFFEGWPVAATEACRAGIPLLIADVGGGAELVGHGDRGGSRGWLLPNPAGRASQLSLSSIRRARRDVRRQSNQGELRRALLGLCKDIERWRGRRGDLATSVVESLGVGRMAAAHAELLHRVSQGNTP